jgi:glycosyltransferase involved in cell wall biosynthesis
MASHPKISVLVPTYNYARFLPEAIESILAQEFTDYELIVSDDASTDESAGIIRRYAARDPRLRAEIHPANLGMVANWNWCLQQARGEYVKYLFGDDLLCSPQALGRLAALLDADPRVVLAASARRIVDEHSRPVDVWNEFRATGRLAGRTVIARCLKENYNLIGEPSAVMFRRATAARGFDPQWRQLVDLEMWLDLLLQGDFAYDPEPLCAFRRHEQQQTVVNRRARIGPDEHLQLALRHLDVFLTGANGRPGTYGQRRALFRLLHYHRKHAVPTPENDAARALLLDRFSILSYFVCWAQHRVTKPFSNLGRYGRRGWSAITGQPFRKNRG